MIRIKVINPAVGIPESLCREWEKSLKKYLREDTEIVFDAINTGFPSVESETQDMVNGSEILKLIAKSQEEGFHGIFVNCFDDPAVLGGREISKIPVLGPYESSVLFGSLLSERLAVISTDRYGLLCEERKARAHRMTDRICKIVNVGLTVLELEHDEEKLISALVRCCEELEKEDIHAAVLGCTGMNYAIDEVSLKLKEKNINVQLIEPLRVGVTMLEYMLHQGFNNQIYGAPVSLDDLKKL